MNMLKASRFTWPAAILSVAYLAAAAFAIAGCGLHFADNGSALPDTAKTIYVQRFENLTYVPGVQEQFMRYMKDAISSRGRLVVIDDPAQADLILTGKILYTGTAPASLSGAAEPLSYGNLMMIAATLSDRKTSAVVWRSNGISASSPASIVAQAIVPTTPQFLKQNLRGPDILNMTDMQVAATQEAAAQGNMMQQLAYEVYADMAWGL